MKKVFLFFWTMFFVLFFNLSAKDIKYKVAVVVDSKTYSEISFAINEYLASISFGGKEGVLVVDRNNSPDSIRKVLKQLFENDNLEGAVLVGDIPVPMIRDAQHLTTAFKMNQNVDWKKSSVPSDRFYDDFDLKFDYIKQDSDKKLLHYYTLRSDSPQYISCDIYSSRIKPPKIPGLTDSEAIAAYLEKAVSAKKKSKKMSHILYFAGHGYNSESMNARIDEAWTLRKQFSFLEWEKGSDLDFINFDYDLFVKERLMKTLAKPELDLAILHHHGSVDCQILGSTPKSTMASSWVELSKRYLRGKLRDSKDTAATKDNFIKNLDIPQSWFAGAFDPKISADDSTYYANMDINIPDMYGYKSNAKIIILDACFNGAFCNDDYIAGYYIFNTGETMVVKANSVNTLQDTWTNELMGLLNEGVCAGNWAKGQMTLESHLLGDPTFGFQARNISLNIDKDINRQRKNAKYWKRLLKSDITDIKALAIKVLAENNAITSQELIKIQKEDKNPVVRLEAFMSVKRRADDFLTEAIATGISDCYELTQRLSTITASKNGDPMLKDVVMKNYEDPAVSPRVYFQLKSQMEIWNPSENTLKEFDSLNIPGISDKQKRFTVSAQRNACNPYCIDPMLRMLKETDNKQIRLDIAEVLGWYVYSYKREYIIDKCREQIVKETDMSVRKELEKTVNRLNNYKWL